MTESIQNQGREKEFIIVVGRDTSQSLEEVNLFQYITNEFIQGFKSIDEVLIGIVLVIYIVAVVIDLTAASSSPDYQGGVTLVVILGILAFLSPKVGYRWFDAFFAMIPFYGIFFLFRIAYRIAHLPARDWSERTV